MVIPVTCAESFPEYSTPLAIHEPVGLCGGFPVGVLCGLPVGLLCGGLLVGLLVSWSEQNPHVFWQFCTMTS